jgi:pilus assembly protein FimV
MTLGALIAMFIYVRYIRTRIKEFKDRAHNIKNDIAIIGSNLTKNKKAKSVKNNLDPDLYFRRGRVELTLTNGEEIQLESIVLSQYGIFVVLPQKQRGAIIGSATSAQWKELLGEEIVLFDNPLQIVNQCSHSIGQVIEVATEIEPIISFSDMAVFKSQFPIAVMHQKQINEYILAYKELKYSDQQVEQWLVKLDEYITQYSEAKKVKAAQLVEHNRQRNTATEGSEVSSPV